MLYLNYLPADILFIIFDHLESYEELKFLYQIYLKSTYGRDTFELIWRSKVKNSFSELITLISGDSFNINNKILDIILKDTNIFKRILVILLEPKVQAN